MRRLLGKAAYWSAVLAACLAAAEVTARVDDWAADGTPLLANPDRERDLVLRDAAGVHGRPNGTFKKWHLNEYGFRGGPISLDPPPGCTRLMVLGASEMFGLYESEGKEFAAQLEQRLRKDGRAEVLNAAMPGMTARRMLAFWKSWAERFRPQVVLIYASPMFYLDENPPALRPTGPAAAKPEVLAEGFQPRMLGRARDLYRSFPQWVKHWREEWVIARQASGKPPEWFFRAVPNERLSQFTDDLAALVAAVKASGATPILLTHANRSAAEPSLEDLEAAHAMRMFFVRATPEVILAFERAAAQATRALGEKQGIEVIDLAAAMNGRRDCFADLVHFSDTGAGVAAKLVQERLPKALTAH